MASIFTKTIKYITVDEVQDSTSKSGLAALDDSTINIYISKANDQLDRYLWYVIDLTDEDDQTIYDLKVASLYMVEQIYMNGDLVTKANADWLDIKSESSGDRSIVYGVSTSSTEWKTLWLPLEAVNILNKYRKIFYSQVI